MCFVTRDMAKIRRVAQYTGGKFRSYEIAICYPVDWGREGIEARLASLAADLVTYPQVLVNVRVARRVPDVADRLADEIASAERVLGDTGRILVRAPIDKELSTGP